QEARQRLDSHYGVTREDFSFVEMTNSTLNSPIKNFATLRLCEIKKQTLLRNIYHKAVNLEHYLDKV
ncbi:hypothetical protein, partial [Flavobacterium sp. NLM]|uniref:hypothetical protein n=1 Tax=Flavobacterium sp. NLM TaxID=1699509 RepID=UPI00197AEE7D